MITVGSADDSGGIVVRQMTVIRPGAQYAPNTYGALREHPRAKCDEVTPSSIECLIAIRSTLVRIGLSTTALLTPGCSLENAADAGDQRAHSLGAEDGFKELSRLSQRIVLAPQLGIALYDLRVDAVGSDAFFADRYGEDVSRSAIADVI
jgi:hypothetical protein